MTAIEPERVYPIDQAAVRPPAQRSLARRLGRGLWMFARRAPFSAFWGCIAVAIVMMAISAPLNRPYDPLKSDFRAMTKAAGTAALSRHRPDRPRYAEPGDSRQPRLAHRGNGRGAVRHHAGRAVGIGERLFRGPASTSSASASSSSCNRFPI